MELRVSCLRTLRPFKQDRFLLSQVTDLWVLAMASLERSILCVSSPMGTETRHLYCSALSLYSLHKSHRKRFCGILVLGMVILPPTDHGITMDNIE